MKKRLLSVLLVVAILISACSSSASNEVGAKQEATTEANSGKLTANNILIPIEDVWDAKATGVEFKKTERMKKARGGLFKFDKGEVSPNGGFLYFMAYYVAITKDDYENLSKEINKLIDAESSIEEIASKSADFYNKATTLFTVCAINSGNTVEDLRVKMKDLFDTEDELNSFFDSYVFEHIGNVDEWNYFFFYVKPDKVDPQLIDMLGDFYEDYLDLLNHVEENKDYITLKKPVIREWQNPADNVKFTAKDIYGKEVTSADLFSKYKMTMVNVWATDCGVCIEEMPELEALSKKFNSDGFGLIGVVLDGSIHNDDAKELLKDTGVTFPNICANEEIVKLLPAQVTPTTYFVDSEGNVVGKAIYGVGSDAEGLYTRELNEHFALLK